MMLLGKKQRHRGGPQTNHLREGQQQCQAKWKKHHHHQQNSRITAYFSPSCHPEQNAGKPGVTGQKKLLQTISGGCPGKLQQRRVPQQAQQAGTSCCKPCCKPPSTKTRQCSREMYTKARFRALAFIQTHPNHFGLLIPGLPNR